MKLLKSDSHKLLKSDSHKHNKKSVCSKIINTL